MPGRVRNEHDGQCLAGDRARADRIERPRDAPLSVETTADLAHTHPDWDLGATVRKMSDFNLTVAPVLDPDHGQILGVITVDDVLELLLPQGWRRDFGVASAGAEE